MVAVAAARGDLSGGPDLVVRVALGLGYEIVAVGVWSRTVGKAIVGITVIDEVSGGGPTWPQAILRGLVVMVPLQVLAQIDSVIEWVAVLFVLANAFTIARRRDDRRGLHDLAASTRPVRVEEQT